MTKKHLTQILALSLIALLSAACTHTDRIRETPKDEQKEPNQSGGLAFPRLTEEIGSEASSPMENSYSGPTTGASEEAFPGLLQ